MDAITLSAGLETAAQVLPQLALKTALLLGAAGLLAFALRGRSASARHLVWTSAIAGVLALPIAHMMPLRLAVLPAALGDAPGTAQAVSTYETQALPMLRDAATAVGSGELIAGAPRETSALGATVGAGRIAHLSWPQRLVALWLVGAIFLLARLIFWRVALSRIARAGERIEDERWTIAADRISRRFDGPSARLIRSARTEMPMTWGILNPVVLLPESCEEWSEERRDVVLRHELAHVARRDVFILGLAQVACAVHWFNPLSWMALHQLRAEAEKCCDDRVLSAGTRASAYAGHLLEMVRTLGRSRIPSTGVLPMAHRTTFEGRLLAILEPGVERGALGRRAAAFTVGGLAALVMLVGAMRPAGASAPPTGAVRAGEDEVVAPAARIPAQAAPDLLPAPLPLPEGRQVSALESRPEPIPLVSAVGSRTRGAGADTLPRNASIDELIELRSVGVTAEYVRSMREAGYADLKPRELIPLRAVGVTSRYVAEMNAAGFGRLTPDQLVSARAVGVTPAYLTELRRHGYTGLSLEHVQGMRAVGVTGSYIEEMNAAGFGRIPAGQLKALRAVGVTPAYLAELRRHGYTGLSLEHVQGMRAVGITGSYIEEMNAAGFGRISAGQLKGLRAVGVTPAYLGELARHGLTGLSLERVQQLRAVGVTGDYVTQMKAAGLGPLDAETLTSLRAMGVTPSYVRELTEAGLGPFTPDQLIRLRASGVGQELVERRREIRHER